MAALTRGPVNLIMRLSAEYRDRMRLRLFGIRKDGSLCEIVKIMEGTRDQPFLALRNAAVERYTKAREPLLFVTDEVFITLDTIGRSSASGLSPFLRGSCS